MRLKELLKGIEILESNISLDESVTSPCSDSRKCTKDSVFVAIKGQNRNGNDYVDIATNNGAKCIVTDDEKVYFGRKSCILVKNTRQAIAHMWSNYYKSPAANMKIIGITGTNGKTSCAYFLYSIFRNAGKKVGLVSTVECLINDIKIDTKGGGEVQDIDSAMTTPDPEVLYSLFSKMNKESVEYVVMEVSSHSLELFKVDPIEFSCAIFTNLSSEHLDFHGDMKSYFNAKKKLFEKCKTAVVNCDDEYGKRLLSGDVCDFYSVSLESNADFIAKNIENSNEGVSYDLHFRERKMSVKTKISGRYNVYNSMLALSAAFKFGIDEDEAIKGVYCLQSIPGRMEKIGDGVIIDYGHTPRAFENVLTSIQEIHKEGKIIALFGCGGDRDKAKRPEMGKIASNLADTVIVTSDNSRNERKIDIIIDILKGIEKENFEVIPNRKEAINRSLCLKNKGDVVVLLGKGHENYEIDSSGKHYFSEKDIVREYLHDKNNSNNIF